MGTYVSESCPRTSARAPRTIGRSAALTRRGDTRTEHPVPRTCPSTSINMTTLQIDHSAPAQNKDSSRIGAPAHVKHQESLAAKSLFYTAEPALYMAAIHTICVN